MACHNLRFNHFIMSNAYIQTDQFQCAHGKKCIDKDQVCDDIHQCQDRSDELDCLKQTESCVHHCDNKSRCLPAKFLCDGEWDCLDGTDEANCGRLKHLQEMVASVSHLWVIMSVFIWNLHQRTKRRMDMKRKKGPLQCSLPLLAHQPPSSVLWALNSARTK